MRSAFNTFQRAIWAGYLVALGIFGAIASAIGERGQGIGLPIWENAQPIVYGAAVLSGIGAVVLRSSIYSRVEQAHARLLRELVTLPDEAQARFDAELTELSERERSVWTLCIGPAALGLPSVLFSGDALPMVPLAAAALLLLLVTFPRTSRFTDGDAGNRDPSRRP